MARALVVFARTDFRGVFREPLLIGLLVAPVLWTLMVRLPMPTVAALMAERYQLDLTPYHPVILTGFLVLTAPIVTGGLAGLMLLEDRDAATLQALRVTPVPVLSYVGYRAGLAVVLTIVYTIGTCAASGLLPWTLLPATAVTGLLGGASALVITLVVVAFAGNKVEGIAVIRALGIVVAGLPLIPFFLDTPWQWLFGIIPTYWPAKLFWTAFDGGVWWPFLVVGLTYHAILTVPLYRRFDRTLAR